MAIRLIWVYLMQNFLAIRHFSRLVSESILDLFKFEAKSISVLRAQELCHEASSHVFERHMMGEFRRPCSDNERKGTH
jgi:hypothetical protein